MRFYNWTDSELANYFVDLMAYNYEEVKDEVIEANKEIVDRFICRYADCDDNNEDCEDFHLTDV